MDTKQQIQELLETLFSSLSALSLCQAPPTFLTRPLIHKVCPRSSSSRSPSSGARIPAPPASWPLLGRLPGLHSGSCSDIVRFQTFPENFLQSLSSAFNLQPGWTPSPGCSIFLYVLYDKIIAEEIQIFKDKLRVLALHHFCNHVSVQQRPTHQSSSWCPSPLSPLFHPDGVKSRPSQTDVCRPAAPSCLLFCGQSRTSPACPVQPVLPRHVGYPSVKP